MGKKVCEILIPLSINKSSLPHTQACGLACCVVTADSMACKAKGFDCLAHYRRCLLNPTPQSRPQI